MESLGGAGGDFSLHSRNASSHGTPLAAEVRARAEPAAVMFARRFVAANLGNPITPRDVVRHLALNSSYFCRLFKKSVGITLTEYLVRVRVAGAQQLLSRPALTITEIADSVGFGSLSHFNHSFRRVVGMSPREYRAHAAAAADFAGVGLPAANGQYATGKVNRRQARPNRGEYNCRDECNS